MKDYLSMFEDSWKRFETNLRGKLRSTANTKPLTIANANFVLKEVASKLLSFYEVEGKWLTEYEADQPSKAEAIKKVIKTDLKFVAEVRKNSGASMYKYLIPVIGAGIGGSIAFILSARALAQIAAMALPAIILYPIAKGVSENNQKNGLQAQIDGYVSQLGTHKTTIINHIKS